MALHVHVLRADSDAVPECLAKRKRTFLHYDFHTRAALYRLYLTQGLAARAQGFRARMEVEGHTSDWTFQRVERELEQR